MKRKVVTKLLAICLSISMVAASGMPAAAAAPAPKAGTEAVSEKTTGKAAEKGTGKETVKETNKETTKEAGKATNKETTKETGKESVKEKLYKTIVTLPGINSATGITSLKVSRNGKDYTYSYSGLKTDAKGNLTLSLPANAKGQTTTVTVNGSTFTGTVDADDENVLGLTSKDTKKETEKETEKSGTAQKDTTPATEGKEDVKTTETKKGAEVKKPETTKPETELQSGIKKDAPTEDEAKGTEKAAADTPDTKKQEDTKAADTESPTEPPTGQTEESVLDKVKVDYKNETLTNVSKEMSYALDAVNGPWIECEVASGSTAMNLKPEWFGKTVYLRLKSKPADVRSFTLAREKAPAVTVQDGVVKITNPASGAVYEYRKGSTGSYTDVPSNGEIKGLSADTYQVRKKAADTSFASEAAAVVVTEKGNLVIPSSVTFGNVTYGYNSAPPQNLTVENKGGTDVDISDVTLSGSNYDKFEVKKTGKSTLVPAGGKNTDAYTIAPKAGLPAGTYYAAVTVAYKDGKSNVQELKFTVEKKEITIKKITAVDREYDKTKDVEVEVEVNGILSGDDMAVTAKGKMESASVSSSKKSVTVTFYLSGDDLGNYQLNPKISPVTVKISKAPNKYTGTPKAPEIKSATYNKIEVNPAKGQEYRLVKENGDVVTDWSISGEIKTSFTSLSSSTTYRVETRYAGSDNYLPGKKSSDKTQATLRSPIISSTTNNKINNIYSTSSYSSGKSLSFTAVGAGSDISAPSLDDVRYVPASWTAYNTSGTWQQPYQSSQTGSFTPNTTGTYTLTVTFIKQVYDGSAWKDDSQYKDTKSISYKVITGTSTNTSGTNTTNKTGVKTGDVSPIMMLTILLVISGGAIVGVIVVGRRRRKRE